MRIVHIITTLSTGGAEMMLLNLLSAEVDSKCSSAVISLSDNGPVGKRIEKLGVPVFTLGMSASRPPVAGILYLRKLIRELRPEVLQGWMYHGNLAAVLAARWAQTGTAKVWSIHHSLNDFSVEQRMTRWVIKAGARLSEKADAIIYCSRVSAAQHEKLGYLPERSIVIPNGFDLNHFKPDLGARRSIRMELGIAEEIGVVGMIARWHPMKDHKTFLRAAKLLVAQHGNVCFVLVGQGVDLNNQELVPLAREVGIDHVYLLGHRRDMSAVMNVLDVLTVSSWGEAFPIVLGEAMGCGVLCVATDVGDSAEIVGETGFTIPPGDPAAMACAWRRLLCLPSDERHRLAKAARDRINKRYSISAISNKYTALYKDLLDSH